MKIRFYLNLISFIITISLITYGFLKGYGFIEIFIYYLYFIVEIITQILNLAEK